MKIFISHASKNADYGKALVRLLTGVGIPHESIIFTSDTSYGIPVGENIFDWLKNRISEKPFVIYLLSPEYYASVACLNEMGAAWVVENQHAALFTPRFDLACDDFKNGAIDPREMGFFLNDESRIIQFIEGLRSSFTVTNNQIVIQEKRREFLLEVEELTKDETLTTLPIPQNFHMKSSESQQAPTTSNRTKTDIVDKRASSKTLQQTPVGRFFQDLDSGKLRDEEVLIIHYAADTARYSLGVGWRTSEEIKRIQEWEEFNNIGEILSEKYEAAISRLDLRKLTQVSETTSHNNPRQVKFIDEMQDRFLDLPASFQSKCDEIILLSHKSTEVDDIPF